MYDPSPVIVLRCTQYKLYSLCIMHHARLAIIIIATTYIFYFVRFLLIIIVSPAGIASLVRTHCTHMDTCSTRFSKLLFMSKNISLPVMLKLTAITVLLLYYSCLITYHATSLYYCPTKCNINCYILHIMLQYVSMG